MPTNRRTQIPALCFLASLIILCGWHLSSADDQAGDKPSAFSLSDLFSSLQTIHDESKPSPANTEKDPSLRFLTEQLNSLFGQLSPKKQQREGDNTRNNHGHSKRKLLYDLSVKAHYRNLLKQNDANSDVQGIQEKTTNCLYFNEGLNAISVEDINQSAKADIRALFSKLSYWSFKICPRQSIQQIRLLPVSITKENGIVPINDAEPIESGANALKLPHDSILPKDIHFLPTSSLDLGSFDESFTPDDDDYYTKIKEAWGQNEQDMYKSSTEYHLDGNSCRYKPQGFNNMMSKTRRSKIVYEEQCCERKERAINQFFDQGDDLMILSVTEPITCQYAVKVCKICPDEKTQQSPSTTDQNAFDDSPTPNVDPNDFLHLMQTYLHHTSEPEATSSQHSEQYDPPAAFPPMPQSQIEANKKLLHNMFIHAYDSYMYNAFPASELHPISCTPGTFHLVRIPALTLIDTLDTLILMRNYTEFARSVERIRYLDSKMKKEYKRNRGDRKNEKGGLFSVNQNVSLFETTIRVLGGLLSAHQLALAFMNGVVPKSEVLDSSGEVLWGYDEADSTGRVLDESIKQTDTMYGDLLSLPPRPCIPHEEFNRLSSDDDEECWAYDGLFLTLAHDIGTRLVHAFDTKTGIPFGTVNLLRGVPLGETEIASLAGAGTLTLEFELLSRLTGDPSFAKAAKRSTRSLWLRRSAGLDLFGKHINVNSGVWTESLSGIGSNSDSFYEYLVKHYTLFPDDTDFWIMFCAAYAGVWKNSRIGDWYVDVDMNSGLSGNVKQTFESLMAFYPGMQILLGELAPAAKTLSSFFLVREFLGLLPERFDFVHWRTGASGDVHPLRPELLESAYFLHLATLGLYGPTNGPCASATTSQRTSSWLWAADFALHTVMRLAWIPCGFATVKKVSHKTTGVVDFVNGLIDNPQAEQKKVNVKHHDEMPSFFLSETIKYLYLLFDAEDNILHQDPDHEWIFTTEAHPIHHVPILNNLNSTDAYPIKNQPEVVEKISISAQTEKIRILLKQQFELSQNKIAAEDNCMIQGNCPPSQEITLPQVLVDELELAENSTIKNKNSAFESFGFKIGPLFRVELPETMAQQQQYGIYSSEVSGTNHAHHHLHLLGSGINIARKCPNFHHPRLIWTLALHGYSIDYNIAHKTSSSDDTVDPKVDPRMQTALASTLYYGTNYYHDGISIDLDNVCPHQNHQTQPSVNEKSQSKINDTSNSFIPGATRYDMGGTLGLFDVSAFGNGDGFVVRHVESREILEVSMFSNDVSPDSTVILASLVTPLEEKMTHSVNTKEKKSVISTQLKTDHFKKMTEDTPSSQESKSSERSATIASDSAEKRVVVADMDGHSYNCEVIFRENGSLLAQMPCSPGFFGKAHITSLIQSDGISVTGPMSLPPKDDALGCSPPTKGNQLNANNFCLHNGANNIQIVYRGECNFTQKTLNQRIERQAAAVIVVNTNPTELFCMAGEKETTTSAEGCSQMDLPPSVLITGNDGGWLLDSIENEKIDVSTITATVSISKQNDEGIISFPYVKGSDKTLQVLASKGWGAQAVHQDSDDSASISGWQLFITSHTAHLNHGQ